MPNRCVAFGCSNTSGRDDISTYHFPKDPTLRNQWVMQVRRTRDHWKGPTSSSVICSHHFTADSFEISTKYYQSFNITMQRKLKQNAIPTIFKRPGETALDAQPESKKRRTAVTEKREKHKLITKWKTESRDVTDCSMKDESTQVEVLYKHVKAQTSYNTRSKGTQTSITETKDIGIQCNLIDCTADVTSSDDDDIDSPRHSSFTAYSSSSSLTPADDDATLNPISIKKYIVFETALLLLFQLCNYCHSSAVSVTKQVIGSFLRIIQTCDDCESESIWDSQPFVRDIPAGNILMSSSILFSGCLPEKSLRIFNHMGCAAISNRTFFEHQKTYLLPSIFYTWDKYQQAFFSQLASEGKPLILGGDGRADSPGHSAKFGTYSMIELTHNIVLDVQIVQSNEVGGSYHMEKEGLVRSVKKFQENALEIEQLITDRHRQIAKWIREELPHVKHFYDVWHIAKGIKKKLLALGKKKGCEEVNKWIKSIINHLYWCALSCSTDSPDLIEAKWVSLVNHMHNKHKHTGLFKKCAHSRLYRRKTKWIKPHTKISEKLGDLLTKTHLCNDIRHLSPVHQTSILEAFHSLMINFLPKSKAFSYKGMLGRVRLAALHFNENSNKKHATTKNKEKRYSINFPKQKKGEHTVRQIRTSSSYNYVTELMEETLQRVKGVSRSPLHLQKKRTPPPLCDSYIKPDKEDAIAQHTSRFANKMTL